MPTGFEQIHDYQVVITTNADGSADFEETIVYDFGTTADRHGILRELRLTQPCNDRMAPRVPDEQPHRDESDRRSHRA